MGKMLSLPRTIAKLQEMGIQNMYCTQSRRTEKWPGLENVCIKNKLQETWSFRAHRMPHS